MLDSLLTGPSSLNMFGGGGVSNKTSRLYRALVETELAVSVQRRPAGHPGPLSLRYHHDRPPRSSAEAVLAAYDAEMQPPAG